MGALAAAAAIALVPTASAFAQQDDSNTSVIDIKLPNKAAAQSLIDQGFDVGDGLDQTDPNNIKAEVVVTPEEQARRHSLLTHQRAQAVPKEWA